jgi:molybdenum-dependent DNA-binding transcriptional regulator ModE
MSDRIADRFYTPLLYVVKKHGSLAGACRALGISHQRISHWNAKKSIPDAWKVVLHQKYDIPYKKFFEQLESK